MCYIHYNDLDQLIPHFLTSAPVVLTTYIIALEFIESLPADGVFFTLA